MYLLVRYNTRPLKRSRDMSTKEVNLKYIIYLLVMLTASCGGSGGGNSSSGELSQAVWNESNWNEKNWD